VRDQDRAEFSNILDGMTDALGRRPMGNGGKSMWFDAVTAVGMDLEQFRATMLEYLATSQEWPSPATIIDLAGMKPRSPYPSPEEAWNMTPKTESESGWLCEQTAAALGACQDSLDAGDRIGARMAFLECYKLQPKEGIPQWWISEGGLMSLEERLEAKQALLQHNPNRRPELIQQTDNQLQMLNGSRRTGGGLVALSGHIESTGQEKKRLKN